MATSVPRREKTRKRQSVNRKQRRQQQEEIQKQIDAIIGAATPGAIEQGLRDEVTHLLGRAKGERRNLGDGTVVDACCNRCQTRYRRQFYRDGVYRRGILTFEVWTTIKVPRISCVCGGMVDFEYVPLKPYGRIWFDLESRARELAGLCVSLRDSVEVLAWRNGQPVAIATLNQMVNQTADLATAIQREALPRVPAVVMLDGIWLKVLLPTGEEYTDTRGRTRQHYRRRKFPLLVAYGVDPINGQRWILDWERGEDEGEASWRRLLERLLERGLCAAKGLKLIVSDGAAGLAQALEMVSFGAGVAHQRCVFHKLLNVRRDVVGEPTMTREQRRERRTAVMADAAAVYQGKTEGEIRQRRERFRETWAEQEPKAVATLERDFDQTLVYLRVMARARQDGHEWRVECVRTTSPLERVQRQFRQKARQVMIFHSHKGVDAGIELVIRHRGLALADEAPDSWDRLLEEALLTI